MCIRDSVQSSGKDLKNKAVEINDIKVLVAKLEGVDVKDLRHTLDQLKSELQKAVILLAVSEHGKVNLIAGVTNNCTDKVHAGKLVNMVATQLGGKGGGRPDMAQAGGKNPEKLDEVLATVVPWVENLIK